MTRTTAAKGMFPYLDHATVADEARTRLAFVPLRKVEFLPKPGVRVARPKDAPAPKERVSRKNVEREARYVEPYRQGLTLRDIGTQFGVSKQRVHQILIRAGEPMRSRRYRKPR